MSDPRCPYAALLRSMLRQLALTSDALLITADALEALPDSDDSHAARADVVSLMRRLAPFYATRPVLTRFTAADVRRSAPRELPA